MRCVFPRWDVGVFLTLPVPPESTTGWLLLICVCFALVAMWTPVSFSLRPSFVPEYPLLAHSTGFCTQRGVLHTPGLSGCFRWTGRERRFSIASLQGRWDPLSSESLHSAHQLSGEPATCWPSWPQGKSPTCTPPPMKAWFPLTEPSL